MNVYGRDGLPARAAFALSISGTAPPINASGDGASKGQDAQPAGPGGESASIQQIPGRLDVLKWPLIAGFLGVFALGAILLARRPVAAVAASAPAEDEILRKGLSKAGAPAVPGNRSSSSKTPSLAEVDAAVGTSLDSLKDQMFRLELRHQAGTISEEEYARERARAEKLLRDLVRG